MFEQYDGYDYDPYLEDAQDFQPAGDSPIETATRYGAFFCLGVFVTFLVRLFGELQPLFWILAIAGLVALAFAIQATRRLELIAIARWMCPGRRNPDFSLHWINYSQKICEVA